MTDTAIVKLLWKSVFYGPNPFANAPVVAAELRSSVAFPIAAVIDAGNRLQRAVPLAGTPPKDRMPSTSDDGLSLLGEICASWSLAVLNETRGFLQMSGARRDNDKVQIWLEFHKPELSRSVFELSVRVIVDMVHYGRSSQDLGVELQEIWHQCRKYHPDFQARIMMLGAKERKVPYFPFFEVGRYWQYGWGANARVFFETASNADGALGWNWQHDKVLSKELIRSMGFPTPLHVLVNRPEDLELALQHIGYPCVIKPIDGSGGRGVSANINSRDHLVAAFRQAREVSASPLMLEQHVSGNDYRLMLIDGRLIAALLREAACVVGNGKDTVRTLLDHVNSVRSRNLTKSRYLSPITIDEALLRTLNAQGFTLDDVIESGKKVVLRSNANRSTGGTVSDVSNTIHPQVRVMAEQLAQATGLSAIGIDYLAHDVSQTPHEAGGKFIEINATPGMAVCVAAGWSEAAIGERVLGESVGRIPVQLTVLSPEDLILEVARLRPQELDPGAGWVCGQELRIGVARLAGDSARPWSGVFTALRHRSLRTLHIICSAVDIEAHGLPLDRFDKIRVSDVNLKPPWAEVLRRVTPDFSSDGLLQKAF